MVRITIDEEMRDKLLSSGEIVELCDESGRVLGMVLPQQDNPLEGWTPITPDFTEEELQRRCESEGPTISTQELIARLRAKR